MAPLTEKKKASNAKWDAQNLKRMSLAVPIILSDQMAEHVRKTGESTNGFLRRAIAETIQRDNDEVALNTCVKSNADES